MTNEPVSTALSPNARYFAGLDVHQKTCDIALVDPEGRVARRWHVKTCPQTLDLFEITPEEEKLLPPRSVPKP